MRNAAWIPVVAAFVALPAAAQSCNTAERSVALILDASGSMWAKLPSGETRIAAAQKAIKGVAGLVDPKAQLSLRVYGAKSPAKDKNCQDTHLAVPFGAAGQLTAAIARAVDQVKAQGFTPIAYSLDQAAGDFPPASGERAIVLVSDGKETCHGDPVVTAKGLAGRGVSIHTIGYAVDSAARMQLEGIARASGGKYFDAPDGAQLAATLKAALNACKEPVKPQSDKPGRLRTTKSEWLAAHAVTNSETGQKVGDLMSNQREITLPAGIYEVKFGPASWKGIEVRAGETTTIDPGVIKLKSLRSLDTAYVLDTETGAEHGMLYAQNTSAVVMPGVYHVRIKDEAPLYWPYVKVDSGQTVLLEPAVVVSKRGLGYNDTVRVRHEGKVVASLNFAKHSVSLPPGEYVVEVNGKHSPFSAPKGGETFTIR